VEIFDALGLGVVAPNRNLALAIRVSNFIQTPPVNERILPESSHI
jgi:hypothetical protein